MRGKKELFMLITGLVLFVSDLVTDIFVAVYYERMGEDSWFQLTLIFFVVPYIIVNGMATYKATLKKNCGDASCYSLFLCSSIFVSFGKEFVNWKHKYRDSHPCREDYEECNCMDCKHYSEIIIKSNESAYDFAWIRYVETLMETTPQWCLQVYIMLHQWEFPWTTVLSAVFSLLSLAWSITTLEKARVTKGGCNFKVLPTIVYFTNQLVVLTSRLFAIVIFAYAYKVRVFILLPFFWLISCVLLTGVACIHMCCADTPCCSFSLFGRCSKLFASFPLTFFVSEAVLESLGFGSLGVHCFMFCVKSLENFVMVVTAVASDRETNMSVVAPFGWASFTIGFLVGIILLIVYTRKLKPKHKTAEPLATVHNEII
jgi:hypothetical protein